MQCCRNYEPCILHTVACLAEVNFIAFLGLVEFKVELSLKRMHSGLVSRIIRDLDSVLLYVVKVRGSSGWIGTVCNQSNMEYG